MAMLDAELRAAGVSLADHWKVEATSVECTVVLGLLDGSALVKEAQRHIGDGYRHAKLKVVPGRDIERVELLRREFPHLELAVDGNGTYDWGNPTHRDLLRQLDQLALSAIEQPLAPDLPVAYQELTKSTTTPICLDESITTYPRALLGLQLHAGDRIGLKPGLLGGLLTARAVHDLCQQHGVPNAVGGMLETGLARAANVVLAALPNANGCPAELSPDGRWFTEALNAEPVRVVDGRMSVSRRSGTGVDLDMSVVDKWTKRVHVAKAN
jgi:O-succinylbenzoate synthase